MTHEALFGELRSILQKPASQETWDALCQHLDLWPHDPLEQLALPYALDIVGRWPGKTKRRAPKRWIEGLLEGRDVASAALANMVVLEKRALTSAELLTLATSPHLTSLTHLDLYHNKLGPEGGAALAAAPNLKDLIYLKLLNNELGPEGAAALAASPHLTDLTTLALGTNRIGDEGAAALATSPHLTHLTSLQLHNNHITHAGAAALAASPNLKDLTRLDLDHNEISDEGAAALAASPHLPDSIRDQWRKP